jgi:Mrp family chromosome partitioning ATPase/capsule polysaccharide export protein KpsE/RkpR
MELILFWRAIYKKRLILLLVPVLGAALAYMMASRFSKTYRSYTQLSTGFTFTESIDPDKQALSYFQIEANFNNLRANLSSQIVIGALAYRLGLHDLDKNGKPFKTLDEKGKEAERKLQKQVIRKVLQRKLDSLSVLDPSNPEDYQALELLKLYGYDPKSLERSINIYRVEASDYLRIEAATTNPQLSAYIVNGLFQEFERYNTWSFSVRASGELARLSEQLKEARRNYEEKSLALRTLQRSTSLIDPKIEGSSALGQIQTLQAGLREAQTDLIRQSILLDEVSDKLARLNKSAPVNNNDRYYQLSEQIGGLRRQLAQATKPAARRALEDSIQGLVSEQVRLRATAPTEATGDRTEREDALLDEKSALTANVRALRSQINILQEALSSEQGSKTVMSGKVTDVQKLTEEEEQAQKEYLALQQRYNKTQDNIQSFNNIEQVLVGQPALEPEKSMRMIFTLLGGAGSFVLLMVWIILMELFDSSLKTPSLFAKHVRARLLASLNLMELEHLSPEMLFSEALPVADGMPLLKAPNQVPELPESFEVPPRVVTSGWGGLPLFGKKPAKKISQYNSGLLFKEAIRRVRHEVLQSGKKIFLVTSLRPEDGKSTLVQYLAYSLGRAGMRVLVVDSNFANNALSRWATPKVWLEDLAAENGETPIGGGFGSPSPYPRIDIVGCRGGIYTPSEILSPISMPGMMRYAREWYDVVLIETADMTIHTDAREMAAYADMFICLASAEHGLTQKDKESINYLSRSGEKMLGMVLNKVDSEHLPH